MAKAKWRVTAKRKEVLAEGKSGPIGYVLEAQGQALALFSIRDRRLALGDAMQDGGDVYLDALLPKSFTDYAFKKGYSVVVAYEDRKRKLTGQAQPLVGFTGELIKDALNNSKAVGRGGDNPSVTITIPTGPHPLAMNVQVVLKTVLPEEIEEIAMAVRDSLFSTITGSDRSAPTRSKLTPDQRLSSVTRAARGSVAGAIRPQRASRGA